MVTEQLGLNGPLVQTSRSSPGPHLDMNISMDGASATSLGNLCQHSVTFHNENNYLLMSRGNLLSFSLCSLPLVLSLSTLRRAQLCILCTFPSSFYIHWCDPLESPILQAEQSQLSAFSHRRAAPVPSSPLWHFARPYPVCPCLSSAGDRGTSLKAGLGLKDTKVKPSTVDYPSEPSHSMLLEFNF